MRKSKFVRAVFRSLFEFRILDRLLDFSSIFYGQPQRRDLTTIFLLLHAHSYNVRIKEAFDSAPNYIIISEMVIEYFKNKMDA